MRSSECEGPTSFTYHMQDQYCVLLIHSFRVLCEAWLSQPFKKCWLQQHAALPQRSDCGVVWQLQGSLWPQVLHGPAMCIRPKDLTTWERSSGSPSLSSGVRPSKNPQMLSLVRRSPGSLQVLQLTTSLYVPQSSPRLHVFGPSVTFMLNGCTCNAATCMSAWPIGDILM